MAQQRFQFVSPQAQQVNGVRTPKQQPSNMQQLRGGIIGGGVRGVSPVRGNVGNVPNVPNNTLKVIQGLGQALIAPALERQQQEQYMEGARRQIEGEALEDIVESQPWYSKIFGSSASVQGARTMAQMRAVESFSTEMERDMGRLRQLNPEEFGSEVMNRMSQHSELGDHQSNIAVQAQLMESYGPLVRSHTKEHQAYIQESMQSEFTSSLSASADFLAENMRGAERGMVSEKDARIIMQSSAAALQPIEGQNPDSYWSGIESATEEAMAKGNFHFVNVVQENLYDHMPQEQKVKFLNDRRKYENQAKSDMAAGEFSLQMAQLKAQSAEGLISPQAAWEGIQKMNQTFRARTGVDSDFLDSGAAEGILTNNLRGIIKERKAARNRAQDEQTKLREIEAETLAARQSFLGGFAGSYVDQGGDRQLTQNAAWGTIEQMQLMEQEGLAPEGRWAETVVRAHTGDNFEVSALSNRIRGGARRSIGSDLNPAFMESYELYRQLRETPEGGLGVARSYAGEYADQFESFHSLTRTGSIDQNAAFKMTFSEAPNRSPAQQETTESLMGYLNEQTDPGWWSRTFAGAKPLTESSRRTLARELSSHVAGMEDSTPGLTTDGIASIGFESAKSNLEILGSHVSRLGTNSVRTQNYLQTTSEEAGLVFEDVLNTRLRESGIRNLSGYEIQRVQDRIYEEEGEQRREPRYWVYAEDEDHIPRSILITGEDLRKRVGKVGQQREEDSRSNFGPSPIPGM